MSAGTATVIMMIHDPLANFCLMLAYSRANCDYDTAWFMSGDYGSVDPADTGAYATSWFKFASLRPEICSAHPGRLNFESHIARPRCGVGEIHKFQLAVSQKDDDLYLYAPMRISSTCDARSPCGGLPSDLRKFVQAEHVAT